MSRLTDLSMPVLVKLGSIAVHAQEIIAEGVVNEFDKGAVVSCLADPDLQKWLKDMDAAALLPKKRRG